MANWHFRNGMVSKSTSMASQFSPEERKLWNVKRVARNTFRYERDEVTFIRLHETDLMHSVRDPWGSWKLTVPERYRTYTTKARINEFGKTRDGSRVGLFSYRNHWWLSVDMKDNGSYDIMRELPLPGRTSWWLAFHRCPFFDGVEYPAVFERPLLMNFQDRHEYWRAIWLRFMEEANRYVIRYALYHPKGSVPLPEFIRGQAHGKMRVIDGRVHEIVTLTRKRRVR